jgi:hypothetical protein
MAYAARGRALEWCVFVVARGRSGHKPQHTAVQRGEVAGECGEVAGECGEVAGECGEVAGECGEVAGECGEVAGECTDGPVGA